MRVCASRRLSCSSEALSAVFHRRRSVELAFEKGDIARKCPIAVNKKGVGLNSTTHHYLNEPNGGERHTNSTSSL